MVTISSYIVCLCCVSVCCVCVCARAISRSHTVVVMFTVNGPGVYKEAPQRWRLPARQRAHDAAGKSFPHSPTQHVTQGTVAAAVPSACRRSNSCMALPTPKPHLISRSTAS